MARCSPEAPADPSPESRLLQLAKHSDLDAIRQVVEEEHANLLAHDPEGKTALHWTCVLGHVETAKFLLQTGRANIDATDMYGWTPLHLACSNGFTKLIETLVASGAAINLITPRDQTALDIMIESQNQDVMYV